MRDAMGIEKKLGMSLRMSKERMRRTELIRRDGYGLLICWEQSQRQWIVQVLCKVELEMMCS